MRASGRKRQVYLFVTAILLPAGVLIGLAARILGQERELAGKRAADERRNAIEQLRRELAARLEAIKLQADWKTIATFEGTVGSGSNAPLFLRWTADGRSLLLLSENPGPSAVLYRIAAEGGNPEMLGKFSGLQHAHMFSVHSDGTQGLFHSVVTRTELWALENFLPKQQRAAK